MFVCLSCVLFFFQAEDGIRDLVRSRGLGDVYKRQSHQSAPLEVRERLALACGDAQTSLRELVLLPEVREALYLCTCNRIEILAHVPAAADAGVLRAFVAAHGGLSEKDAADFLYAYEDDGAVRHLFRVASGIDSLVMGEPQILGQVKEAYRQAVRSRTNGVLLNKTMHHAFRVAKRIRTETGIADNAVSVSFAAVELAKKIFGDLAGTTVLVVGAGEMAELAPLLGPPVVPVAPGRVASILTDQRRMALGALAVVVLALVLFLLLRGHEDRAVDSPTNPGTPAASDGAQSPTSSGGSDGARGDVRGIPPPSTPTTAPSATYPEPPDRGGSVSTTGGQVAPRSVDSTHRSAMKPAIRTRPTRCERSRASRPEFQKAFSVVLLKRTSMGRQSKRSLMPHGLSLIHISEPTRPY